MAGGEGATPAALRAAILRHRRPLSVVAVVLVLVTTLIVVPSIFFPAHARVLEGDRVLTENLVLKNTEHVILRNGVITGATPNIRIEVFDEALLEG